MTLILFVVAGVERQLKHLTLYSGDRAVVGSCFIAAGHRAVEHGGTGLPVLPPSGGVPAQLVQQVPGPGHVH